MHVLMTPGADIPYDDIKDFELKGDLLHIHLKGRQHAVIFPNGHPIYIQIQKLRDIHRLHNFLKKNNITSKKLSDKIGKAHSAITNLFRNNTLSGEMKRLIEAVYPGVFDNEMKGLTQETLKNERN